MAYHRGSILGSLPVHSDRGVFNRSDIISHIPNIRWRSKASTTGQKVTSPTCPFVFWTIRERYMTDLGPMLFRDAAIAQDMVASGGPMQVLDHRGRTIDLDPWGYRLPWGRASPAVSRPPR